MDSVFHIAKSKSGVIMDEDILELPSEHRPVPDSTFLLFEERNNLRSTSDRRVGHVPMSCSRLKQQQANDMAWMGPCLT